MIRSRSVAVAQTCPVAGDVPTNLEEHVRLARLAADGGAQVVLASSHAITLIVGAPVRTASRLHIGAFILSPDRTIALYTKHRLGAFPPSANCDGTVPPAEATVFEPGERNPLVEFGGNVAAVAVCADVGRSSHPQQAASRGAKTYLASMFVIPSEFDGEVSKLRGYAVQHSMMVALANFGRPTGGLASAGRSAIWSETGELLVQLGANGAGIAVVTETQQGRRARSISLDEPRGRLPSI
jgi:predicted amidohydrolase